MDIRIEITETLTDLHKSTRWYLWQDGDVIKTGDKYTILKEIELEMQRTERAECVDLDLPQIYQYEKGGD